MLPQPSGAGIPQVLAVQPNLVMRLFQQTPVVVHRAVVRQSGRDHVHRVRPELHLLNPVRDRAIRGTRDVGQRPIHLCRRRSPIVQAVDLATARPVGEQDCESERRAIPSGHAGREVQRLRRVGVAGRDGQVRDDVFRDREYFVERGRSRTRGRWHCAFHNRVMRRVELGRQKYIDLSGAPLLSTLHEV